jgi:hypothetical protein
MTEHQPTPLSETVILKAIRVVPIPQAAIRPIARHITEIAFAISQGRLSEPNRTPEARRERRELLETMSANLGQLVALRLEAQPTTRNFVNDLLAPLGDYLSIQTFEDIGIHIDTSVSVHVLSSREAASREGPYRALETEVAASRRSAAGGTAARVIVSFLDRLKRRIDSHLQLMRENKGGRPGNVYRRFAIRQLALAYQQHAGKLPTTSVTGPFMKLCEQSLPLLEIELGGLERAVGRELNKKK